VKTAEPLLRERLEILLDGLASVCPEPLAPYLETLSPMLLEHHFRLRATLVEIIHRVSTIVALSPSLINAADQAKRPYTSVISYPSRRFLHLEPSISFTDFIKKGILFDFKTQVESVSELLSIPPSTILSYIEQRLRKSGWSEIDEEARLREDWDGNVSHGRVVWIVPRFHTLISEQFQKFLHEAMESGCYDKTVFEAIKNVVRGGDPDFIGRLPRTKPFDIPDVTPVDGQSWINEIEASVGVVVETLRPNEWTTVDEERLISTTDGQSKRFASSVRIRSLVIASALTDRPDEWPAIRGWPDAIPYLHPEENLTLKSAQVRLLEGGYGMQDISVGLIPLVSAHTNRQLFHGFRRLVSLHPYWLNKYGLTFSGFQIELCGQVVARYEEWQEGYEDECYTRDLLSAGTRLIVRNDWLGKVLEDSGFALLLGRYETRKEFEGFLQGKAKAEARRTAYTVLLP
jgi:hypothetical protein